MSYLAILKNLKIENTEKLPETEILLSHIGN